MNEDDAEEANAFWNRVAAEWEIQVGDEGDSNRRLNSDPVLWRFAGDVAGLNVLDAGCGTGYLSRQLAERGGQVTGVDLSEEMIKIARAKAPDIESRVDSCAELTTVADGSMDMVVANYVLMDTPDLDGTMQAFHRVLKTDGVAIIVFSHPCFPQGRAMPLDEGNGVIYRWPTSYFEQTKCVDPPWAHFTSEFIWFHRPLSDYWKAFKDAGFEVLEFAEPRIAADRYHFAECIEQLAKYKSRPYSVAFKLRKCGCI
jgi:ubiquinone/menaquinone biosynthesis C-methylase UbiE